MAAKHKDLFDKMPGGRWVCWDRPPVMYVCYNSDYCSYYPMDTGIEEHGPFPLFSWEYALSCDGRGGIYVTGGHDENRQVRVQDPYSVGHKPPFPDAFFGPMVSELWRYDIRSNAWEEVDQDAWGPRQCVAARHMTHDRAGDCLVRTAACREGHSPKPPVPLRGWGTFGVWTYEMDARRWTWMQPSERLGPLTYDSRRRVILAYSKRQVRAYDGYANTIVARPESPHAPEGDGAFVYVRKEDCCLFYGESGQVWIYNIDENAWTERKQKLRPMPRAGFAFALDPHTGSALLFGGRKGPRFLDDTWLYNIERNEWRPVEFSMKPEPRFWAGRGMVFDEESRAFVLYGGVAAYRRVKARYAAGDIWIYKMPAIRKSRRKGIPAPALSIQCRAKGNMLRWKSIAGVTGYQLERGEGAPGEVHFEILANLPPDGSRYLDHGITRERRYEYRLAGLDQRRKAGTWSLPVRTDPPIPSGLVVSVLSRGRVVLKWQKSGRADVTGYRVRRVRVSGEDKYVGGRIFDAGPHTEYLDAPEGLPDRHYQYQVQAVNRQGVCSGWSAPDGTIPSAPEKLVMIPDPERGSIELKWKKIREEGIAGYNIYRWVEPPFRFGFKTTPELITPAWWKCDDKKNPDERMLWVKVNPKLIRGRHFTDRHLRKVNTWYYIRAVNKLGVEGHYRTSYSLPVWRWYDAARKYY